MSAIEKLNGLQFKFFDMSKFRDGKTDRHGRPLGQPDMVRAFAPGDNEHEDWDRHGKQVGFLALTHDSKTADEIWVDPEHRRKGIATQMIQHAERNLGHPLAISDERSDAGEALARKLGAPPRKREQKWDGIGGFYPA